MAWLQPQSTRERPDTFRRTAVVGTTTNLARAGHSDGKRFGDARDWAGTFGVTGRIRAAETALSRVSVGKATESQRLFRTRLETGIAQDCVVAEAVPFGPVSGGISR
jgi:hypothetical protein